MDHGDLKVFQTVAQTGSITKASQILNFVQSNVTARIKHLESDLQTLLFYRHSRGVTLTPAGKTLLIYVKKIMHLYNEAYKAIQDSPVPSGQIAIGSMETTAAVRLPAVLAIYHQQFPNVDLSLTTGSTQQLINYVLTYELDGALVASPVQHPEIIQEPVLIEELVLITDPLHPPVNNAGDIKLENVLAFRSGCSYRAKLEDWLYSEGRTTFKIMEFGSLEAILGCVAAGFGVSLMPASVVKKYEDNGSLRCHSISNKFSKVETVFIRRKDSIMTSALGEFLSLMHNQKQQKIPKIYIP